MTGCLPVGTDRDAGSTVCEVSGGWWVVARTVRWIVVEWVDRGGREKERGNGRGRTAGGWAAGRGGGDGTTTGTDGRGGRDWESRLWTDGGQGRGGVHAGSAGGTGRVGRARKRSL